MKIAKGLLLMALLLMAASAAADTFQTYNLAWSGAPFSNSAWATGQITIDITTLPNPGGPAYDMYNDIESLTVTVMGAGLGDGTWTKDDLSRHERFRRVHVLGHRWGCAEPKCGTGRPSRPGMAALGALPTASAATSTYSSLTVGRSERTISR